MKTGAPKREFPAILGELRPYRIKIRDEKKLSTCSRISVEEKLSRSRTDVLILKNHHKLA
jgi:hypothetical protein